jgi:hypothetical protein
MKHGHETEERETPTAPLALWNSASCHDEHWGPGAAATAPGSRRPGGTDSPAPEFVRRGRLRHSRAADL